jgi:hypothetical protein
MPGAAQAPGGQENVAERVRLLALQREDATLVVRAARPGLPADQVAQALRSATLSRANRPTLLFRVGSCARVLGTGLREPTIPTSARLPFATAPVRSWRSAAARWSRP